MIGALSFLFWIAYAIYEGRREAYYFSMKVKAVLNTQRASLTDEHAMFTEQRALVLIIMILGLCKLGWPVASLVFLASALAFPFIHDGSYYVTRKSLDGIYPEGWFAQSVTSTAVADQLNLFDPIQRSIYATLGIGLMIYEMITLC